MLTAETKEATLLAWRVALPLYGLKWAKAFCARWRWRHRCLSVVLICAGADVFGLGEVLSAFAYFALVPCTRFHHCRRLCRQSSAWPACARSNGLPGACLAAMCLLYAVTSALRGIPCASPGRWQGNRAISP